MKTSLSVIVMSLAVFLLTGCGSSQSDDQVPLECLRALVSADQIITNDFPASLKAVGPGSQITEASYQSLLSTVSSDMERYHRHRKHCSDRLKEMTPSQ